MSDYVYAKVGAKYFVGRSLNLIQDHVMWLFGLSGYRSIEVLDTCPNGFCVPQKFIDSGCAIQLWVAELIEE
jgi:hypothetical protein